MYPSHFSKLQDWSITIRLLSVISRILNQGGVLPSLQRCSQHIIQPQWTELRTQIGTEIAAICSISKYTALNNLLKAWFRRVQMTCTQALIREGQTNNIFKLCFSQDLKIFFFMLQVSVMEKATWHFISKGRRMLLKLKLKSNNFKKVTNLNKILLYLISQFWELYYKVKWF